MFDLCGDSKLGNNLAVGVDSSTKAWPELRWVEKMGTKTYFLCFLHQLLSKKWSHENKQRGKMASSPEGEVTVLAEETVAGGDGSNSAKSKSGASVLLKREVKTRTKKSPLKKIIEKQLPQAPGSS